MIHHTSAPTLRPDWKSHISQLHRGTSSPSASSSVTSPPVSQTKLAIKSGMPGKTVEVKTLTIEKVGGFDDDDLAITKGKVKVIEGSRRMPPQV